MTKIKIRCGEISAEAELNDSATAQKIVDSLPLSGRAMRWGAEVYFTIPVDAELEADARDVLQPGELGFWPVGHAFCIFWGKTPASRDNEARAASDVNVFGRLSDDAAVFDAVVSGSEIRVEKI